MIYILNIVIHDIDDSEFTSICEVYLTKEKAIDDIEEYIKDNIHTEHIEKEDQKLLNETIQEIREGIRKKNFYETYVDGDSLYYDFYVKLIQYDNKSDDN